jgi:hypothetical protein
MSLTDYSLIDYNDSSNSPRFRPAATRIEPAGSKRSARVLIDAQGNLVLSERPADRTAQEFEKHERRWKRDTMHISSPMDKYLHPSYMRIIGLGRPALPHILRSMQQRPADWFYALRSITGENPVPAAAAGDVRRMVQIWIQWGKQEGLI